MKQLHNDKWYCWSVFNEEKNIDFHSYVWIREGGNVVFDPLPISEHDLNHLNALGGASFIIITNSDHIRDSLFLSEKTGAKCFGPKQESKTFPLKNCEWLSEEQAIFNDLTVFEISGSKSPGELALYTKDGVLICGDLVRSHQAGSLCILPASKLNDVAKAKESARQLFDKASPKIILIGDGWPVFSGTKNVIENLLNELRD